MTDEHIHPEVVEKELLEVLGVRTDMEALCWHIEKKFMPELREKIKQKFMERKKILLIFKCDFANAQISAELFAQEDMVDEIVANICEKTNLRKEETEASLFIWSLQRRVIPSFMIFTNGDNENAIVSSARWGLEENVYATKN